MMHTKVSVDQKTHAETGKLKVKRGRRNSTSGAPPPWEASLSGEAPEGTKKSNHRKYTIGML